jgi:hypothetical protein
LPVLKYHLELLEDEAVGESVPAGVVLDEVVLVGGTLLDGPVDGDARPGSVGEYQ